MSRLKLAAMHPRPLRRPDSGLPLQVGALPWRLQGEKLEVVLVQTLSTRTRRWIIPKGWPLRDAQLWEAAQQEAFEEAGVNGEIGHLPIGKFKHDKTVQGAEAIRCNIVVYPLRVTEVLDDWPEQAARPRQWFSIDEAVQAVEAKGLARLLEASPRELLAPARGLS